MLVRICWLAFLSRSVFSNNQYKAATGNTYWTKHYGTSSLIGTWNWNFPLFGKLWQTDQTSDGREVTLPKMKVTFSTYCLLMSSIAATIKTRQLFNSDCRQKTRLLPEAVLVDPSRRHCVRNWGDGLQVRMAFRNRGVELRNSYGRGHRILKKLMPPPSGSHLAF